MPKKNNSEGKPYYSQRNNKIKPGEACNVTSLISALSAAGWPVERLPYEKEQPEDALMRYIITDKACERLWKRLDPKGQYAPNEWHAVLNLGTCALVWDRLGIKDPCFFKENSSADEIANVIQQGGAAAVSGRFPLEDGRILNHVVSVVGGSTFDDGSPESFTLDDPWGDYHTSYKNHNGNDVVMDMNDFLSIIKPCGKVEKMAHLVRAYA